MNKISEQLTPDLLNRPIGHPGIGEILPPAADGCADDALC